MLQVLSDTTVAGRREVRGTFNDRLGTLNFRWYENPDGTGGASYRPGLDDRSNSGFERQLREYLARVPSAAEPALEADPFDGAAGDGLPANYDPKYEG